MSNRGDVEQPVTDTKSEGFATRIDGSLKLLYFPVYMLALVTMAVGGYMYFFPDPGADHFQYITGSCLFACGCMLIMNNDLIVTTIRMWIQLRMMESNNAELEENVGKQAEEVHKLRKIASGLEVLEQKFSRNLDRADKMLGDQEANTATKIRIMAGNLVEWYCNLNHDLVISKGEEQEEAEDMVGGFFRKTIPDYDERHQCFHQALNMNRTYQELDGIPTEKFSALISAMLANGRNEPNFMQLEVNKLLDPMKEKVNQLQTQQFMAEAKRKQAKSYAAATTSAVTKIIPRSILGEFYTKHDHNGDVHTVRLHVILWVAAMVIISMIALWGSYRQV